MTDSFVAMFKMSWPPLATWVGGTLAVNQVDLDPDVIYPILAALALAIWRAATFVKGVQAAIKDADEDRKKLAQQLDKIFTKLNAEGKKLAVIESGCPVAQDKRNTCAPFPTE